jgi:hypothetical protein
MPTVHNPTEWPLLCVPLRRHLEPGETVNISDEDAALISRAIFEVVGADEPETAEEELSAPVRQMARRGGQTAEVTGPPEREMR